MRIHVLHPLLAVWQGGFNSFHYLSIYNHEKFPNFKQNLPKLVRIFAKYVLKKTHKIAKDILRVFKSGEILPNLVTLVTKSNYMNRPEQ